MQKIHTGVSNYDGKGVVYYIPEDIINKYSFAHCYKGMNSINSYHPGAELLCSIQNLNIENIVKSYDIPIKRLSSILTENDVRGFYYLKIDTEGHDTVILKEFFNNTIDNTLLPHMILFESNTLTSDSSVNDIIRLSEEKGYDLINKGYDTLLMLNLNRLKKKGNFTEAIPKYYIMDYPLNYDQYNPPHENTLAAAKEFCSKCNYSGVTFQGGRYEVRCGKYMKFFDNPETISYIFM